MTKTSAPKILSDADFDARMATYVPANLPAQTWEAWEDEVAGMARAAEPSSAQDLTYVLGSICAFLSWSTPIYGEDDLAAQVTPDQITRYLAVLEQGGTSTGTRENRRSQLFRVQRGIAGRPARKAVARGRSPFAQPYSPTDVAALRAIAVPSATLTTLLALLDDDTTTTESVLAALEGISTQALCHEFATIGLKFDRRRWRPTWASHLVRNDLDFVTLAHRHGFSRNDCERYLQHHPAAPGTIDQLRG